MGAPSTLTVDWPATTVVPRLVDPRQTAAGRTLDNVLARLREASAALDETAAQASVRKRKGSPVSPVTPQPRDRDATSEHGRCCCRPRGDTAPTSAQLTEEADRMAAAIDLVKQTFARADRPPPIVRAAAAPTMIAVQVAVQAHQASRAVVERPGPSALTSSIPMPRTAHRSISGTATPHSTTHRPRSALARTHHGARSRRWPTRCSRWCPCCRRRPQRRRGCGGPRPRCRARRDPMNWSPAMGVLLGWDWSKWPRTRRG